MFCQKKYCSLVVLVLANAILPVDGWSATISVKPKSTFCDNSVGAIQTAIDSSNNGDIIDVQPGIYVENIDFKGKQIVVKSNSNNPNDTIIDGNQKGLATVS